jgi:hypothetical protein
MYTNKKKKVSRQNSLSLTSSPPARISRPPSFLEQVEESPQSLQTQEQDLQDTSNQAQNFDYQLSQIPVNPPKPWPAQPNQQSGAKNLPRMERQWKLSRKPYKSFLSLNCGWYCEKAAIEYVAEQKGIKLPPDFLPLKPKSWLKVNYSPGEEGKDFVTAGTKCETIDEWEGLLQTVGPVIVGGKLGKADWGKKLGGVGHFILLTGVDKAKREFEYLDPLKGSAPLRGKYDHMLPRIEKEIYYVQINKLRGLSSNRYCWRTSQLTASGEPRRGMKQALASLTKNPYPSNTREREVIHVLLGRSK